MVIEHFKDAREIYRRFAERGRMMPEGVAFIESWIDNDVSRCFQLMECESLEQLQQWADNWTDLADFEFVPVISSSEARAKVMTPGA